MNFPPLNNDDIINRIDQKGKGRGFTVVTSELVYLNGKPILHHIEAERHEAKHSYNSPNRLVNAIIRAYKAQEIPAKSNGTKRSRKKTTQLNG